MRVEGTGASSVSRRLWAGQFLKAGVSWYNKLYHLHSRTPLFQPVRILITSQTYFIHCYCFFLWFVLASPWAVSLPSFQWYKSFLSLKIILLLSKKHSMLILSRHDCYLIICFQDILIYVPFIWYSSFTDFYSLFISPFLLR